MHMHVLGSLFLIATRWTRCRKVKRVRLHISLGVGRYFSVVLVSCFPSAQDTTPTTIPVTCNLRQNLPKQRQDTQDAVHLPTLSPRGHRLRAKQQPERRCEWPVSQHRQTVFAFTSLTSSPQRLRRLSPPNRPPLNTHPRSPHQLRRRRFRNLRRLRSRLNTSMVQCPSLRRPNLPRSISTLP